MKETLFLIPDPGHITVKYFNKFLKCHKFLKMNVSHKNHLLTLTL